MKRLLLVAALVVAPLVPTVAANACTLETCPGTKVVCTRVNCHICYYKPEGARECIT